jgi:hypothetical protein
MSSSIQKKRRPHLFVIFGAMICALGITVTLFTTATNAKSGMALGISVTNSSSREIHHLYLSPTDQNKWGPDLLDGTVVKNGESFTIADAACTGNEIKIIAEDQQGCFVYGVISCAQATTAWTMTNEMPVDCGN